MHLMEAASLGVWQWVFALVFDLVQCLPECLAVGGVCFSVWLFGRWKQVLCIYLGSLTNALRDVQYILNIL